MVFPALVCTHCRCFSLRMHCIYLFLISTPAVGHLMSILGGVADANLCSSMGGFKGFPHVPRHRESIPGMRISPM